MKDKDTSLFENILASIENIEYVTRDLDYPRFLEDDEARRVVAMELDSLGGALGICPGGSFQEVDPFLVWDVIQQRVPKLKIRMMKNLF